MLPPCIQAQQQASDAAKHAHAGRHKEQAQQAHSSLALVQSRAQQVLPVLRALAKLVLHAVAAMQTAAASLQPAAQPHSGQVS